MLLVKRIYYLRIIVKNIKIVNSIKCSSASSLLFSLQAISKKVAECIAQANQVATETFSNMKTVRCFANEDGEIKRYEEQLDVIYGLNKREAFAYAASTWANNVSWEERANTRNSGSVESPLSTSRMFQPGLE